MRTALVTGAASGIGRALARQLAAEGYAVHMVDVAPDMGLADELGGLAHRVDVSRPDEWAALAATVPTVDMLVLNAGRTGASFGPPWEAPHEEWQAVLGVNLLGAVGGLRAFLPGMLERGRPGHVLLTASLAGLVAFPGGGAYAASKHALVAVAEQTALALQETDISVTVLCPALVRTGMSDVGKEPGDVAAEALDACREGRFLVVDDEWVPAVEKRARRLVSGEYPAVPAPASSTP